LINKLIKTYLIQM